MKRLAVVDCETTGFSYGDRVIELAIVVLHAQSLETLDEFDTLVNPMRDVGRVDIHGIRPSMLDAAPTFDEILGGVAERLDVSVLVAHNLPFDARFIRSEFDRAGVSFDSGAGICTLSLTGEKLECAVERYGIALDDHHCALADARASAELLRLLIQEGIPRTNPARVEGIAASLRTRTLRREAITGMNSLPLRRILSRARYPSSEEQYTLYFQMLDWVVSDASVTPDEQDLLDRQIASLGLTSEQVAEVHMAYFQSVLHAAWRDQRISSTEQDLLRSIAKALKLEGVDLPDVTQPPTRPNGGALTSGLRVCFTGTALGADGAPIQRGELERLAASRDLQPVERVSKKGCDLLVAEDPESGSGKANTARKFGIPIISVAEFLSCTKS